MDNGNNSVTQLLDIVENLKRLGEEIEGLKDDKKQFFLELKAKKYSIKAIRRQLALTKKAHEDLLKVANDDAEIARLLGTTCYSGVILNSQEDIDPFLVQRFSALSGIEDQIKDTMEEIRDAEREAKGAGFSVKELKTAMKVVEDPDTYAEFNSLVDTYVDALQRHA